MGDAGSLPLGGVLAYIALVIRQEVLLLLMAMVVLIEIGSVVLMGVAAIWAVERIFEADLGVDDFVDPFVDVPWAYLYVTLFTVFAAGWRYRVMQRGNLIWLPDAEDLDPDGTTGDREPAEVG